MCVCVFVYACVYSGWAYVCVCVFVYACWYSGSVDKICPLCMIFFTFELLLSRRSLHVGVLLVYVVVLLVYVVVLLSMSRLTLHKECFGCSNKSAQRIAYAKTPIL